MNKEVLDKILTECEQDIEDNDWEKVYKYLVKHEPELERLSKRSGDVFNIGVFTDFCLNNGINPLEAINYVPRHFMRQSEYPEITIPNNIEKINSYAFCESSLEEIIVPASVKTIGDRVFALSENLKKVILEGCETIGDNPFILCYNLEELHIPNTLTNLSASIIAGVKNLKKIVYNGSKEDFDAVCNIDDEALYNKMLDIIEYTA